MSLMTVACSTVMGRSRIIHKVEAVVVESPVGTVPRLPWQVWVSYTDGQGEWRQVRWSNALRSTEEGEANPAKHPAGSCYSIEGFIIGDNTTEYGFPWRRRSTLWVMPTHVRRQGPRCTPCRWETCS